MQLDPETLVFLEVLSKNHPHGSPPHNLSTGSIYPSHIMGGPVGLARSCEPSEE